MPSDAGRQFAALSEDLTAFRNYLTAERGLARTPSWPMAATWTASPAGSPKAALADYLRPNVRELAITSASCATSSWRRPASPGTSSP